MDFAQALGYAPARRNEYEAVLPVMETVGPSAIGIGGWKRVYRQAELRRNVLHPIIASVFEKRLRCSPSG